MEYDVLIIGGKYYPIKKVSLSSPWQFFVSKRGARWFSVHDHAWWYMIQTDVYMRTGCPISVEEASTYYMAQVA